jgi:uncharacterized protein YjiS (DUF1127 family)
MEALYNTATGLPETVTFSGTKFGFGRIGQWINERRRISRIARELNRYSDRDLADMGMTRGDIPAVARGVFPRA